MRVHICQMQCVLNVSPPCAGVFLESITEFTADARAIDQRGDGKVKAIIQTPSGALTRC